MPEDLKIVVVPKELYYHEVAYVRGLETAARAMLAALKEVASHYHAADDEMVRVAIAQAEAAGIKAEG